MNHKIPMKRTLGPVSTQVIDELVRLKKSIFTLIDASMVYKKDKHKTGKFLSDLIKQGVLTRIKAGTYLILQVGQENIQASNWPVIARELAKPNDYFISYYSAMRLNGMTTHPLLDVYITLTKRHRNKKINPISYHFIYLKPSNFWGVNAHWVSKHDKVYVSDIERTLLDGLERPNLCGGIKEIIRGIWVKQNEIDWEKMVEYAEKFHTKAAVKRLGFIFEILGLGGDYVLKFKKMITNAKDYILLDPNGLKEGKYSKSWFIRINVSIDELKAGVWE